MTLLVIPQFFIVIAVIAIIVAITTIPLGIYAYIISKPTAKEMEEYTKAIQEGMNQVDIDFEIKHPRVMFECPYDLKSCDHVDTLTMTTDIMCQDCERYTGMKPPKF